MRPLNLVLGNPSDSYEGIRNEGPRGGLHMYNPRVTPWQTEEQDFPDDGDNIRRLRHLVRYAILAPSSHNSQPWKFSIGENKIGIYPDLTRWLKVADPDRRELHISLGCALENLLVAAEHFGFDYTLDYHPDAKEDDPIATVHLMLNRGLHDSPRTEMFDALTRRRTFRGMYELRPVSKEDRLLFHNCSTDPDITLRLSHDPDVRRKVVALTTRADEIIFDDPAYRKELGSWLGQGALGSSGLLSKLLGWVVAHIDVGGSTARKDAELLMSAPIWGVICADRDDRITHVKVGQLFERLCLTGVRLGLGLHPMSQILEVPDIRREVAMLLPSTRGYPQLAFRLGYSGHVHGHTPRRQPVEVER